MDAIHANSTRTAGKMPLYPRHNHGKRIILPRQYFAPASNTVWNQNAHDYRIVIISYTKIVKIAATRSVFTTKNHQNAFVAGVPPLTQLGKLTTCLERGHPIYHLLCLECLYSWRLRRPATHAALVPVLILISRHL